MRDRFRGAVLSWWEGGARAERDRLPWRGERDPWAVLVSEVMLAQTQAARVAERFPSFLARFPDPAAMAAGGAGEVLRAWSGLGYNRRAAALHRCSVTVVERHGGRLPTTLAGLVALPGVGPYTARAVLAFAHDQPVGAVDTNIARVLARAVAGRALRSAEAQALADSLVAESRGRQWNLALMDLGSLVCRARTPRCSCCPLLAAGACAWQEARRRDLEPASPGSGARPDPASAGAGISGRPTGRARQGAFEGSDRQLRGRLLRAACLGEVARSQLAAASGCPDDPARVARAVAALLDEGLLVEERPGVLRLP